MLVLPGNHDFYDDSAKLWNDFRTAMAETDNHIILLNRFEPYVFDVADETVVFYPAYCQDKHSKENNLAWIKQAEIDPDHINVGIAHGAIEGVTPDKNQEYFLMGQSELNRIPVDVWLIGHTHVPFPGYMTDLKEHSDAKIFNAGTHSQTDLHNNTAGYGFLIDIEKENGEKRITARAVQTGTVRFYDLKLNVKADSDTALEDAIKETVQDFADTSVVRLHISGTARQTEYENRNEIYETYLNRFLDDEIIDGGLSEEITLEKIRSEYAETSFAARFLEALADDPKEMGMAYELMKECKE